MRLIILVFVFFLPILLTAQEGTKGPTPEFELVSGPDLSGVYKNELLVDHRGLLWLATQKGLIVFDGYNWKRAATLYNDPPGILDQPLESIIEDSTGTLWFSTRENGICRLDPSDGSVAQFRPSEFTGQNIHDSPCHELFLINDQVVIQTFRGFVRFNPYEERFIDFHIPFPAEKVGDVRGISGPHPANWIHHYLPDSKDPDVVWLGTRRGLLKYDLQSKNALRMPWPFDYPMFGDKISILDIRQNDNELFIGTYSYGIVRYAKDGASWSNTLIEEPNREDPDKANVIQALGHLDGGTLMFASNIGPGAYNIETGEIQFYTIDDNSSTGGQFRNIILDGKGLIWTNNARGVYRSKGPAVSTGVDSRLLLSGLSVSNGMSWSGFSEKPISIELQDFQNTLEVSYVLPNPLSPSDVTYSYKLGGFDNEWVEAGNRRFARYTNLPGGKYKLLVKAVVPGGQTKESELLDFEVLIPFYKSWWFITFACLVVLGTISWIVWSYFQKERMRASYDLKLAKMEMQSLRSQMNPHFIFNSLNSIKNYVVNKGPDEAAEYLAKFSQLIRTILENSKSDLLTLDQELQALRLYIEIESMRFQQSFTWDITVDPEIDTTGTRIPPMLIQPYVENAIWHGLQHRKEKGHLGIRFEAADKGILCIVKDDGIGRAQAAEMKRHSSRHKESLGTRITNDRMNVINVIYGSNIHVTTRDLVLPDGSAAGTEVTLFIDQNLVK